MSTTTTFGFRLCSKKIIDRLPDLAKNFNIDFSSDTVSARSFKLCSIKTLTYVFRFTPDLMTLALFKVKGVSAVMCVRKGNCKLCFLGYCQMLFKSCMVAAYTIKIMHNIICGTLVCI